MCTLFKHRSSRVYGRVFGHGLIAAFFLVSGCKQSKPKGQGSNDAAKVAKLDAAQAKGAKAPEVQAEQPQAEKPGEVKEAVKEVAKAEKPAVKAGENAPRPLYYERLVTAEDLKGRSLREFSLLRNTIFARVGNSFRKTWLDEHFRAQPWYKPLDKAQLDRLTSIDKKNVELIVQAQEALTKSDLESSRDALLAIKDRNKMQELELRLLSARLGKWAGGAKDKDPKRTPLEDPMLLDKTLKLANLREMSRRDLRILRNMIYARRGRCFKSPLVSSYFARMDWYDCDDDFSYANLNPTDRKNIRIIKSLEHSLGGAIRDADHPEDDWMYVA